MNLEHILDQKESAMLMAREQMAKLKKMAPEFDVVRDTVDVRTEMMSACGGCITRETVKTTEWIDQIHRQ